MPLVLGVETQAVLVVGLQCIRRKGVQSVQAKSLEKEVGIGRLGNGIAGGGRVIGALRICGTRVEVAKTREIVPSGTPAGKNIFAVNESVEVTTELHVVLAKRIRVVVLDLELPVVVVCGKVEALAEGAVTLDLNFRCAREDGMALAIFALDQNPRFVDLVAMNGG